MVSIRAGRLILFISDCLPFYLPTCEAGTTLEKSHLRLSTEELFYIFIVVLIVLFILMVYSDVNCSEPCF